MRLSRRVWLGSSSGPQLDEVHERVVVLGVDPGTPKESISTARLMGNAGSRISGQHFDELEVKVTFGIDVPKGQLALRRQIFDAVKSWALTNGTGGNLYTNVMSGKRVYIDKVIVPNAGDLFEWTNSFDILFRAYSIPFWRDRNPTEVTKNKVTSGSVTLDVPGDVTTMAEIEFTNVSGKVINNLTVTAGSSSMSFTKLNLGGSDKLQIVHTSNGRLRILAGGSSRLAQRSGSDELYIEPGKNTITVKSERAGNLRAYCYGRYL